MTRPADPQGVENGPLDPFAHIDLWDRQPGEGATPYRQFTVYRDLGQTRSVQKVADKVQRSRGFLQRVAYANRWVERATAWDMEQDREFRAAVLQQRRQMVESHVRIARTMLEKIVTRLRSIEPGKLSPRDLVYWLDVAVKVERLALGETTEVHGHQDMPLAGVLTEEEILDRLRAIRDEADARLARSSAGVHVGRGTDPGATPLPG